MPTSSRTLLASVALLSAQLTTPALGQVSAGHPHPVSMLSVDATETPTGGIDPAISADGRFVAYAVIANDRQDVVVADTELDTTQLVSTDAGGGPANGHSRQPSISADGRYVSFTSGASDLVVGDGNERDDVFVRDLQTQSTQRVSVGIDGGGANNHSVESAISGDGRFVAFGSFAANLAVGGGGTPGGMDGVFIRDLHTATTTMVSTPSHLPARYPSVSHDGRYVAYSQFDEVWRYDRLAGLTELVSVNVGGSAGNGVSSYGSISADGRWVAFWSGSSDLTSGIDANPDGDIFVRDMVEGWTELVTVDANGEGANHGSGAPAISPDGRYVAFFSLASDLVMGHDNNIVRCQPGEGCWATVRSDIFVRDLVSQSTTLVSVGPGGQFANEESAEPSMSGGGSITFQSLATNLVAAPLDTNEMWDVFVWSGSPDADTTPPNVTGSPGRIPDGGGWYNAPVVLGWQAADPAPSSGLPSQPADTLADIEGADIAYESGPSCDPAGNCATGTVTLSMDRTAPAVEIVGVLDGATYPIAEPPEPACESSDDLSGLANEAALTVSGGNADGSGVFTATCDGATDVAGNTTPVVTASWRVAYNVSDDGFSGGAVEQPPTVNEGRAGRVYAVSWQLVGADGRYITDPAVVGSVQYLQVSCSDYAGDPSGRMDAEAAGRSGLRYDAATDMFVYNWATPSAPGCYEFVVLLRDGTSITARFALN